MNLSVQSFGLGVLVAFSAAEAAPTMVRDFSGNQVKNFSNECWQEWSSQGSFLNCNAKKASAPVAQVQETPAPSVSEVQVDFNLNEAVLDSSDVQKIKSAASNVSAEKTQVVIRGYTDFTGSPELNQSLAQERAEAAKAVVVAAGIPAANVSAVGVGPATARSKSPCASLSGDKLISCMQADRKAEIVIQAR